ncbi:hypothetical protein AX17_004054 [Amanita inopinata Kibby_2008]|nr:hypothetical protein AX17_004054 [Amanita inopinata Kibby_2008]
MFLTLFCRLCLFLPDDTTRNTTTNEPDNDEDSDDDQALEPKMNKAETLSKGVIVTQKNKFKEFTILLVGETGTGKTSLLNLFGNIVAGRAPQDYEFFNDDSNEAGGGEKQSQTNSAKLYKFESNNKVKFQILDTPGLADTRGIQQDALHKESIAKAIKQNISTVDAVIILANGTIPRLGVATEYALSTLSSIFPRNLASNIGILFTNVASPLSWNFDQESLPDVLRGSDNQFLLDNPLAMWKKYLQLKSQKNFNKRLLSQLKKDVEAGHTRALNVLGFVFDWLDGLSRQPTNEILDLYKKSQDIEHQIANALSRMSQMADKKKELEKMVELAEGSKLTMEAFKNYKSIITQKIWKQIAANRHNTLCSVPSCHSNCHVPCSLDFSLDPVKLVDCWMTEEDGKCRVCKHNYLDHRHYNAKWEQVEDRQETIDPDAEKKYKEAVKDNTFQEKMKQDLENSISTIKTDMQETLTELGELTQSYAQLSLSGSFAKQVKMSVRLLETNLEAMKTNKADSESIQMVEKSLEEMKRKLEIVESAGKKANGGVWKSAGQAILTSFKF